MGVTGQPAPTGDPFDIDYVAHEMGHQFGANHTQNNSCQRNSSTAVEPGSASTIMGYAGICEPDVQNNSDAHFHGISLNEIANFVVAGSGNTCAVKTELSNSKPEISLTKTSYNIPASTPFALTAVATDADGDNLTYCWEQIDNETANMPPKAANSVGPAFRSLPPSLKPVRYFPDLERKYPLWEVLPSVNRTMDFRCTVRDNHIGGGCTDEADVSIRVTAQSGPFIVLYPNTTTVSWLVGSTQTVSWDVAKTDLAPVNCSLVDIFLSIDGGVTYPIQLADNVPNSGSSEIQTPGKPTTRAKVMVMGADNVFFDVSNANFKIISTFTLSTDVQEVDICQQNLYETFVSLGKIQDITQPVMLSAEVPSPLSYTFSINPVMEVPTKSLFTLVGLQSLQKGYHDIKIKSISGNEQLETTFKLFLGSTTAATTTAIIPALYKSDVNPSNTLFKWNEVEGAKSYLFELSASPDFNVLIKNDMISGATEYVYGLQESKVYYWRIKAVSPCIENSYSEAFTFRTSGASVGDVQILTNEILLLDKGKSGVIDSSKLNVSHTDENYVFFTVTHKPAFGQLLLNGIELNVGSIFTLSDIRNGKVGYTHDNGISEADEFRFTILDDQNRWAPDNKFIIKIRQSFLGVTAFKKKNLLCFGDVNASILAEGYGGKLPYQYSIDGLNFQNSTEFVNLKSGNYVLTIKDGDGITNQSNTIVISDPTLISINTTLSDYDILVEGNGGVGNLVYSIDGITFTSEKTFKDPGNGIYTVYAKDENGCLVSSDINIDIPALTLTASITTDILCASQKAVITCAGVGGILPYTYSADGQTFQASPSLSVPAGRYAVFMKDKGGKIIKSDSLTTKNPSPIEIVLIQNKLQIVVKATGGTGKLSYSIDNFNFSTKDTVTFTDNGTYKIYVKDESGCIKSVSLSLNVLKDVTETVRHNTCFGKSDGYIKVQPTNGTFPFKYSLNGSAYGNIKEWSGLPAGTYQYIIKDNKNDSIVGNITILQPDSLVLETEVIQNTLTINASGGTPPYQYSIDNGFVFLDNNVFPDLPQANYSVVVKDKNGCRATTVAIISSTNDSEIVPRFIIYPNPVNDLLFVQFTDGLKGRSTIELFNIAGSKLEIDDLIKNSATGWTLQMSGLAPGLYMISIADDQSKTSRLVVKH
ncbi:MAG: T9SS type A sorting domain-containing protein [Saprospiraceae bacterium]|nr:T9SS type A sorting domain-containing protein [Saprospiraceae bacterium]